jgi:hypothetical protein
MFHDFMLCSVISQTIPHFQGYKQRMALCSLVKSDLLGELNNCSKRNPGSKTFGWENGRQLSIWVEWSMTHAIHPLCPQSSDTL